MSIQSLPTATIPRLNRAAPVRAVQAGGGNTAAPVQTQSSSAPNANLQLMSQLLGNEQHLAGLHRWGLASPGMLRFAAGGGFRRAIASMLTGVPVDQIIRYGRMADMMRVEGMRPGWAHLLVDVGLKSPGDLSRYGGNDVTTQIQRGILMAAVVAKAIEVGANEARTYEVPNYDQLNQVAQKAVGLGSVIHTPEAQTQSQPQ